MVDDSDFGDDIGIGWHGSNDGNGIFRRQGGNADSSGIVGDGSIGSDGGISGDGSIGDISDIGGDNVIGGDGVISGNDGDDGIGGGGDFSGISEGAVFDCGDSVRNNVSAVPAAVSEAPALSSDTAVLSPASISVGRYCGESGLRW